jgi:hypothetical protein
MIPLVPPPTTITPITAAATSFDLSTPSWSSLLSQLKFLPRCCRAAARSGARARYQSGGALRTAWDANIAAKAAASVR